MQQTLEIPTDEGPVELTVNGSSDRVVLVVHGLGGHAGEWLHQTAARLMPKKGLATARISLYNEGERRLDRVSLQRHMKDVNSAIAWLLDNYDELYIAGHSLGGVVSILSEHEKAVKMALWDPAPFLPDEVVFDKRIGKYITTWSIPVVVSEKLVNEWKQWDAKSLLNRIKIPAMLIFASDSGILDTWKGIVKDPVVVKGDHTFTGEGEAEEVVQRTIQFFNIFQ